MASNSQVKQYLAYWFQLGKRIIVHNGSQTMQPQTVIEGNRYSDEFEDCWRYLSSPESREVYLEGTSQTIQELLSSSWEIEACARCSIPVPVDVRGLSIPSCPCADLPSWPNLDLPLPRLPVETQDYLRNLCHRLSSLQEGD